jgi:hypothetical protein
MDVVAAGSGRLRQPRQNGYYFVILIFISTTSPGLDGLVAGVAAAALLP